jgi:hypothetical protein
MAYARVATFQNVPQQALDEITREIREGERPEGLPATEVIVLADRESGKLQAITFFDSEDDYRQGDEALRALNPPGNIGSASIEKFEVAVRRSES